MSFGQDIDRAVEGLKAMNRALSGEALAEAVEEAADLFVEEAQRRVSVLSGRLKADIQHEAHIRGRAFAIEKVYVNSSYAHLVERGHASPRKPVVPEDAKALQIDLDTWAMSSKGGPASRRPFMRPAADAAAPRMARVIEYKVQRVAGRSRDIYGRNRNRTR